MGAARMSCPTDMRNCACGCIPEDCREVASRRKVQKTGRGIAETELSRLEREQMAHSNRDGHVDVRLMRRVDWTY
jgi:hypothetical protein